MKEKIEKLTGDELRNKILDVTRFIGNFNNGKTVKEILKDKDCYNSYEYKLCKWLRNKPLTVLRALYNTLLENSANLPGNNFGDISVTTHNKYKSWGPLCFNGVVTFKAPSMYTAIKNKLDKLTLHVISYEMDSISTRLNVGRELINKSIKEIVGKFENNMNLIQKSTIFNVVDYECSLYKPGYNSSPRLYLSFKIAFKKEILQKMKHSIHIYDALMMYGESVNFGNTDYHMNKLARSNSYGRDIEKIVVMFRKILNPKFIEKTVNLSLIDFVYTDYSKEGKGTGLWSPKVFNAKFNRTGSQVIYNYGHPKDLAKL